MTQITVDAHFASKLQEIMRVVDLCDASGSVSGRFVPEHYRPVGAAADQVSEGTRQRIVVDPELASKLQAVQKAGRMVEICDPSGRMLGYFIPAIDLSEWEAVTDDISDEELDRRSNSGEKTYTTAEVIAYLESL
jgi:hypothetical protein